MSTRPKCPWASVTGRGGAARAVPRRPPVMTATRPRSCSTTRPYTPLHGMGLLDRSGVRRAVGVDAPVRRRGDRAVVAVLRRHDRRELEARDRAVATAG